LRNWVFSSLDIIIPPWEKLIKQQNDELPGGIIDQYGLNQEGKANLWILELQWESFLREAVQFIYISVFLADL
jgi:hypothetical protein